MSQELTDIYNELRGIRQELKAMNGRIQAGEVERAVLKERMGEQERMFKRIDTSLSETRRVLTTMQVNQAKLMLVNGLTGGAGGGLLLILLYVALRIAGIQLP